MVIWGSSTGLVKNIKINIIVNKKKEDPFLIHLFEMIQGPKCTHEENDLHHARQGQIIESESELDGILEISKQLESSIKQRENEPKMIKELKSKNSWMKYIHKKIPFFPEKMSNKKKRIYSQSSQKPSITDDNIIQSEVIDRLESKKSAYYNKIYSPQIIDKKQKFIEPTLSIFNPQLFTFSKEHMKESQLKYHKKLKVPDINSFHQRVRQSRSQSKAEKVKNQEDNGKGALNINENRSNIFKNLQVLGKHNSYHSLDKNQGLNIHRTANTLVHSKIEEKLHLPVLARISQLKSTNKVQTIGVGLQNTETQMQKSPFYNESVSKTQKSSPFMQKIVKIPIDRLKPLRPEEIKMKFHQKVKEQQKNRAKQRAIEIFQKQQKQSSPNNKQKLNLGYQSGSQEGCFTVKAQGKKMYFQNVEKVRSKNSVHHHKKQKELMSSKVQNIFKSVEYWQKHQ